MTAGVKFRNRETGQVVVARPVGVQKWEVAQTPDDEPTPVDPATSTRPTNSPGFPAIDVLAAEDDDEGTGAPSSATNER